MSAAATSAVASPIHHANIAGQFVRFYSPPEPDPPDLPWVSIGDVLQAAGVPVEVIADYLEVAESFGRTITVEHGKLLIVPHKAVLAMLKAMAEVGRGGPMVVGEYGEQARAAGLAMVAHMPAREGFQYLLAGASRHAEFDEAAVAG